MLSIKVALISVSLTFRVLLVFVLIIPSQIAFSKDEVVLGLLVGREIDRDIYLDFVAKFSEQYVNVEFDHIAANDTVYKLEIDNWLTQGKVDVSYGQVGNRLCRHASENKIASLDNIWQDNDWDKYFSSNFKQSVSCNGKVYGVPIAYYYWGFFYKKSLFQKLALSPPETWEQFLDVSQSLQLNGVVPFTIGTKNKWPAAAWFDYLNLRLNGLAFHQELLQGKLSFLTPKVRQVFEHWKTLVDKGYFIDDQKQLDWQQALPFLYRDMAGMMLTGGFLANILPAHLKEDIGFFRFPSITETVPMYEEVPIDVYLLNTLSSENDGAKALLKFSAKSENQEWLSEKLGYLPPNFNARIPKGKFSIIGSEHVNNAAGHSQYFDRDAHRILAQIGPSVFADFIESGDIENALNALESARLSISE